MKLIQVTVHGYKRFKEKSSMNVDGRVIAVVGPNESGKSSFLRALQHLNTRDDFIASGGSQELSRDAAIPADQSIIEAKYILDDADRKATAHIPEAKDVRWVIINKRTKGSTFYVTQIPEPKRDLTRRKNALTALGRATLDRRLLELHTDENIAYSNATVTSLIEQLNVNVGTLAKEVLLNIREVSALLQGVVLDTDDLYLQGLPQQLSELADYEEQEHPAARARHILFNRRPRFLFFDEEARLLKSEYALDTLGDHPPLALKNITRLANLDLNTLRAAIEANDQGRVETMEESANARLKKIFTEVWTQSGVIVRFRIDQKTLHILVRDSQTAYVSFAERSDGLRQFVALLAFISLESADELPILLIDEAELHLHYDAQADLVQMFAKQQIATKVIYTTHSIGCLPEDLGTGIRLIEALNDGTSKIQNWFWDNRKQGFSPLLFGMGARTLAFIPVRHALITEGATDLILLPTLLREATGRSFLGFQVVPGLSSTGEDEIAKLEHESPRTAYLVDSDKGGSDIRRKLGRANIPPNQIFSLPDDKSLGLVLEDFIEPDIYQNAINEELHRSYGNKFSFLKEDLPVANRPGAIRRWCEEKGIEPPNKRAVAYRILDFKNENPDKFLLIDDQKPALKQMYIDVATALGLPSTR